MSLKTKQKIRVCAVVGCDRKYYTKGYCMGHFTRWRKHGDPLASKPIKERQKRNSGARTLNGGYFLIRHNGKLRTEHSVIAEKALGKPLRQGIEVHHVDSDGTNNKPHNLVVCPSHSYHALIEQRTWAYEACGHADWFKCWVCKQWDDPKNDYKGRWEHWACVLNYNKQWRYKNTAGG